MDVIELTQTLVSINTVNPPGNEARCIDLLKRALEPWFSIVEQRMDDDRANIIAMPRGREKNAPVLLIAGHLDTVPVEPERWSVDPWGGEVETGKLYGRGSTDMKGGIAAVVSACTSLAESGVSLQNICLLFTYGEETGCEGAQAVIDEGLLPEGVKGVLIAEPTSNQPIIAHKGVMWLHLEATGRAAHASRPDVGDNAITTLVRALSSLSAVPLSDSHPILGTSSLTATMINGGVASNVVPDRANAVLDVRTIPGQDHDGLLARIRSAVDMSVIVEPIVTLPPLQTEIEDEWVREVCQIAQNISGTTEPGGATYFTDACVLSPALNHVPTIICGPGNAEMAHQVDEWCSVSTLHDSVDIYVNIIRSWLRRCNDEADVTGLEK